jgi:predicted transcriptional regulator
MARKKSKIIQVPMPEELLVRLNAIAAQLDESRSLVIREAVASYITKFDADSADAAYEDAYRRVPEEGESGWRDANAAAVWGAEDFSGWEK